MPTAASSSSAIGPASVARGRDGPPQPPRAGQVAGLGAAWHRGDGARRRDERDHRAGGAREPAEQAQHEAGPEPAVRDHLAEIREEQPERHRAQPGAEQRPDARAAGPCPEPARDKHGAYRPRQQVEQVRHQLFGLRGEAVRPDVTGEQPDQPEQHAQAEQARAGRGPGGSAPARAQRRRSGHLGQLEPGARRLLDRRDRLGLLDRDEPPPGLLPALAGFRPPVDRVGLRRASYPDAVITLSPSDRVLRAPVRDAHLVRHGSSLHACAPVPHDGFPNSGHRRQRNWKSAENQLRRY